MNSPVSITVPIIETERSMMLLLAPEKAQLMLDYYLENRMHLTPWEPQRDSGFYRLEHWQQQLTDNRRLFAIGSALKLVVLNKNASEVIGVCNFTNIQRGIFQACNLGYSVAAKYQGQGYMREILQAALAYVFDELNLHRVMANYMTSNQRSAALLKQLGFKQEGLAKSYLKIAGIWQDHVLTARINPAH